MKMIKVLAERLNRKVAPMHTVGYNATIAETAKLFVKENIGAALVEKYVPEQGAFAGIISEKDIIKCCAENVDMDKIPIHQIMHKNMIIANILDDVKATVRKMRENHIRHIPLEEHGKIIALISIRDLMYCVDMEQEIAMSHINDMFGATRRDVNF